MRLQENIDAKSHLDEFFNVISKLEDVSIKLDDDLKTVMLL